MWRHLAIAAGAGLNAMAVAAQTAVLAQRGQFLPWASVAFAIGIGSYFALIFEPGGAFLALLALAGVIALGLSRRLGPALAPLAGGIAIIACGFGLAAARAHWVAAPVLEHRYYGPIEGRVIGIDRSASDALRLKLDRVRLDLWRGGSMPDRVRIALTGAQDWVDPVPGMVVMTTGHLDAPNGPVEPGDFDFRRRAWFEGLGAVGYVQSPVLMLHPPDEGLALWIDRTRQILSKALRDHVPGDAGGLVAAVMTGDRSGLSNTASDRMRDANLYHMVSISGMHMAILAGILFGTIRFAVALVPPLALRLSSRKLAAAVVLPVAGFYLALAGRDIATERAYVTIAVMMLAVLMDRRALSLRVVAIAALIVMVLRPESLVDPGFQMSFAAVVALVVVFTARLPARLAWLRRGVIGTLASLILSSLVAGLATAPFAAAHFNRIAHYGLIANLLTGPILGLVVMPGAILLMILGPLGWTEPWRSLTIWGSDWILAVADDIAARDGAVSTVIAPPGMVLPLIGVAAAVLILWQGRARWFGLGPGIAALWLWAMVERPDLLISASGGLVGVMGDSGRDLNRASGEAFVAGHWLANDGATRDQQAAAAQGFVIAELSARTELAGLELLAIRGARLARALSLCDGAGIVISTEALDGPRPCLVLDTGILARSGAIAGWVRPDGLYLVSAAALSGDRLWTTGGDGAGEAGLPLFPLMVRP